MQLLLPLATSVLLAVSGASAQYNLVRQYSGTSFFDGWSFYGSYDNLTNGDVNWVSEANATQSQLAYVNDAGRVIIKVDNTSFVPWNEKRDTVRIESIDYFPIGSVFIFDATHLPYGCSVWPAFWTKGINWPTGGEIDILEGVNLMTFNQMALHTQNGCMQADGVTQSGATSNTNCSTDAGCTVAEQQENSFGASFAAAGGGVWATQFDTSGVFIWFWSRNNVPTSVSQATDSVDPSSWGTPSAAYPSSSCNISQYFSAQNMVLDITLCGDWAGVPSVYQSTCGGDGTATACYLDNVINNGTNYNDAYFEINYVKVFSLTDGVLLPSVSGGTTVLVTATASGATEEPSPTSGSGNDNGNGSSGNDGSGGSGGGNGAEANLARVYVALVGATVLAAFSWTLM